MNKKLITILLLTVFALTAAMGLNMRQATAEDVVYGVKNVTGMTDIDVYQFADKYLSGIASDEVIFDADTKVDVIIELGSEKESLLALSRRASAESIAKYIASAEGAKSAESLAEKQLVFKQAVEKLGIEISYKYSYSTIVNGLAATVRFGDIEKLMALNCVYDVALAEYYNIPDTKSSSTQMNIGAGRDATGYTGAGMTIAVIDTGVEWTHEAFSVEPETQKMTVESIAEILPSTAAYNGFALWAFDEETTKDYAGGELTAEDVYKSGKIPFYFDYTVASAENIPFEDHGTHVAGIAAGNNGKDFTGAAYDAQVLAFNVFGSQGGASSIDILAAINDAVLMGVDSINMSLGTASGYKFTGYQDKYYKMAEDAGILVTVSSGNSYWAGYYGVNGNNPRIDNMDYGVVGTPGAYDNVFTVGSYNAYEYDEAWFYLGDERIDYIDASEHKFNEDFINQESEKAGEQLESVNGELALVPLFRMSPPNMMGWIGRDSFDAVDLEGKIAVLELSQSKTIVQPIGSRINIAAQKGAIGIIFILDGATSYTLITDGAELPVPVAILSRDYYAQVKQAAIDNKQITVNKADRIHYPLAVSDFSSRGATQDLKLKPDILATGSPIYSSVLKNQYGYMSGTSMAAPNITGITMIVKQYVNEMFPGMTELQKRATIQRLIMSTATIIADENGVAVSPRTQGAGLANVLNAVTAKAYIMVEGQDKTKLELGDDPEKLGVYTLNFKVVNISGETKTYAIDPEVITEAFEGEYLTLHGYRLNPSVSYKATGNGAISETGTLFVEANGSVNVTITLTLSDEDREYLDFFPNGCFVEGFVRLVSDLEDGMDLNIPFMGYYGDWYELPLLDNTMYEGGEDILLSGTLEGRNGRTLGRNPFTLAPDCEEALPDADKIAISTTGNGNSSLYVYRLGALRNLYSIRYTLNDYDTDEAYIDYTYLYVPKAYSGQTRYVNWMGYPMNLDWDNIGAFGDFASGERFIFRAEATLIDDEGNEHKQSKEYIVTVDNNSPVIIEESAKLVYENGRLYFTADFYDNEYLLFAYMKNPNTSTGVYPFHSGKGEIANFKVDVTDYFSQIKKDGKIKVDVVDYAYNTSTYEITLPMPETTVGLPKELNVTNTEEELTLAVNQYREIGYDIAPYGLYDIVSKEYFVADESIIRAQEDGILALMTGETEVTLSIKIRVNDENVMVTLSDTFTVKVTEEVVNKANPSYFYITFSAPYEDVVVGEKYNHIGGFSAYQYDEFDFFVNPVPWYADNSFTTAFTWVSSGSGVYGVDDVTQTVKVTGNHIYIAGYGCRFVLSIIGKGGVSEPVTINLNKSYKIVEGGEEFVLERGGTTLSGYNGEGGTVIIPEGVTAIDGQVFYNRTEVKKVVLPESLKQINEYAFANSGIEEIVINSALEYIGDYAFIKVPMKSFVLPEGSMLYNIGMHAFTYSSIELLDLSNAVPTYNENGLVLDYWSFSSCENLKEVIFPKNAPYVIGVEAFEGCSSLKEIDLTGTAGISYNAFRNCTGLEKAILPEGLEVVSQGLFNGCSSLKEVEIPSSVKYIYSDAFRGTGITELYLGKNIETIGDNVFRDCVNLRKLVFEEGFDGLKDNPKTRQICKYAFAYCTSLTEVVLPDSVTTLPYATFLSCNNLSDIVISGNITAIGEYALANTAVSSVEIPEGVTSIGHYAFSDSLLESINLGDNLSVIGNYAFSGTYLTEIHIPESVTYIGNYAFHNVKLVISELRFADGFLFLGAHSFDAAEIGDIYLPASLEAIDFSANAGARYHIDENCELIKVIGDGLYANGGNVLMHYQGNSAAVTVADGTVKIFAGAFAGVNKLNSLVLPASIRRIGDAAFAFEIKTVRFLGDAPILESEGIEAETFLEGTTILVNADAKGFDSDIWSKYNVIYMTEGYLLNEKIVKGLSDDEIVELYSQYLALSGAEKAKVTNAAELISEYMNVQNKRNAEALEEAKKAAEEAAKAAEKAREEYEKALEEARKLQEQTQSELEESKKNNEDLQKRLDEITNLPSCAGNAEITVVSVISFVLLAAAVVILALRKRKSSK